MPSQGQDKNDGVYGTPLNFPVSSGYPLMETNESFISTQPMTLFQKIGANLGAMDIVPTAYFG